MRPPEKCPTCHKPVPRPEWHECSHVECPNRKPVTAAPPSDKPRAEQDHTHG